MKGLVAVLLCATLISPAAAGTGASKLTLVATRPVTVAGSGFGASEAVRLTVRVQGARYTRRKRADARGSWRVVLLGVNAANPCDVEATALGGRGSKALLQLSERVCPTLEP
jgi:hypothetical protein